MVLGTLPIISVIVPVYHAEDYIEACLQSIVSQDYKGGIECILVDDCGNDASIEKARRFVDAYDGEVSFVFAKHDNNRGAGAARNTGIRNAKGDYYFFLDSDDTLPIDALSSLYAPLASAPYDMVIGGHQTTGMEQVKSRFLVDKTVLSGSEILFHYLLNHLNVNACNRLIKASFIKDNRLFFYEGIIYEDDLWTFESSVVASSVYLVDKTTYFYTIREGSVMTSTLLKKRVYSSQTIIREMYEYSLEHNLRMDSNCHHRIERYRSNLFRMLKNDWPLFRETYVSLREAMHKPWRDCFLMDGWRLNKQIRDFHLALPSCAGAVYLRLWIKADSILHAFSAIR